MDLKFPEVIINLRVVCPLLSSPQAETDVREMESFAIKRVEYLFTEPLIIFLLLTFINRFRAEVSKRIMKTYGIGNS